MSVATHFRMDPHYERLDAAQWTRHRLDLLDVELDTDARLTQPIAAHRESRTLLLQPGLPWDAAYFWICRGLLFIEGGVRWAEEFGRPSLPAPPNPRHLGVTPLFRTQ